MKLFQIFFAPLLILAAAAASVTGQEDNLLEGKDARSLIFGSRLKDAFKDASKQSAEKCCNAAGEHCQRACFTKGCFNKCLDDRGCGSGGNDLQKCCDQVEGYCHGACFRGSCFDKCVKDRGCLP